MPQHDTQKQRTAWKLGQWLGSWYRAFLRQEARFVAWLAGHGMPVKVARILLWAFRIVAVLVLLYLAFWLALVFLGVAVLAHAGGGTGADHDQDWVIPDPDEHMKNPGYDPNLYNDPPDPSYYDPRYDKD